MNNKNTGLIAAAILIVGFVIYLWNPFLSEEDRISIVLTQIENDFYLTKGENKIKYASRVTGLKRLFDQKAEVDLEFKYRNTKPLFGKQEITQSMVSIAGTLNEFSLNFYDTDIRIHEDSETATLQTSCEIRYQGDELAQASDLSFEMIQKDGEWLIKKVVNETPWEF